MKPSLLQDRPGVKAIAWMVILTHLFWSQIILAQGIGSVALVSNVTGKATFYHEGQMYQREDARFKGPVVLGDRIQTGAQSMVAMLVGNDALVSLKEFSEMRVTEEPGFDQVIHLTAGQVCVATKGDGAPIKLEIPGATVTVNPGSMASIQVGSADSQREPAQTAAGPDYLHRTALGKPETLHPASDRGTGAITVQLKEGSASLVSHIVGKAPVLLGATQGVEVVGGIISPPFESKEFYCQVQDLQQDPQHTAIPEELKDEIKDGQQAQATQLVKLLNQAPFIKDTDQTNFLVAKNEVIATSLENETTFTSTPSSNGSPAPGSPQPNPPTPNPQPTEIAPASPGDAVVQSQASLLTADGPFLQALPSTTTTNGPPVIFPLSNFSGSILAIDPNALLANLSEEDIIALQNEFGDPDNPGTILAGIRVEGEPDFPSIVNGGLLLFNSTVEAPVEFIQIGQGGSTLRASVNLLGSLLQLNQSTFNAQETLIALRNGILNATNASQPLVIAQGAQSQLTLAKSLLTMNPSTLVVPHGLLSLKGGAGAKVLDTLIDMDGSFITASGGTTPLVTIEGGSQLELTGSLLAGKDSTIVATSGILSLLNSVITIRQPLGSLFIGSDSFPDILAFAASANVFTKLVDSTLTGNQTLLVANNSQMNIEGPGLFLAITEDPNNFGTVNVTNGGLVKLQTGSSLDVQGAIIGTLHENLTFGDTVILVIDSSLKTGPGPLDIDHDLIVISDSTLTSSGGLLELTNGIVETTGIGGDVLDATGSTVTTGETMIQVANGTLTLGSDIFDLSPGSSLMSEGGLLSLESGSRVILRQDPEQFDAVFLNDSSVTARQTLMTVQGNSFLKIPGDLVGLVNSSRVSVTEGGLLEVINSAGANEGVALGFRGLAISNSSGNASQLTTRDSLFRVSDSRMTLGSDLIGLFGGNPGIVTVTVLNGGLLEVTNGSVETLGIGGDVIDSIGGQVTIGATGISLDNSSLTLGSDIFDLNEGTSLTSNGGLLSVNAGSRVALRDNEEFFDAIYIDSSSVTSVQTLVSVKDNSEIDIPGDLVGLYNESSLTITNGGLLEVVNSLGNISQGSAGVNLGFSILRLVEEGSSISTTGTLASLNASTISLDNSKLDPIFEIIGAPGFIDNQGNFNEGVRVTDGGLLTLSNGSQLGGNIVDEKLLNATRPLFLMIGSTMATSTGFLDINTGSRLVAESLFGGLVRLAASSLTVRNGHLVHIVGIGSTLDVTGNLVTLSGNGSLIIESGALVRVSNRGIFDLRGGGLVQFSGSGNTFSVTNNFCANGGCSTPFQNFPNLRVQGPVNISGSFNPLPGFNEGDSLVISPNAAILVNDGGAINLTGGS